ncbi:NAD-dependent epimerase/dehydratase family protein [Sphingobium aquiterrae]|uniref:NAD-dependent epimerase/dehydratase family protein n=1 Tax=Sphingobium aquiterrae TaxID=2038656 RepID=UPI0030179338
MRILVLGASGFVGRRIVAQMVARHGPQSVIAGVRRAGAAPAGVEARVVDACNSGAVEAAARGTTHIVNCVMGSNRAIVASARTAIAAAERLELAGLVHFSSVAVYGDREGEIREDAPQGVGVDGYGAAKVEAEAILRASPYGRITILRPGLVHGPGSVLWTARIARLLMAGRLGDLGACGQGICNLVHVDDVAAFAIHCLGEGQGGVYNLVAPEPPSWNGYLTDFARALGLPPRRISPARLRTERYAAYPLKIAEMLGGRLGMVTPPPMTPGLTGLFNRRAHYVSDAAHAALPGWAGHATAIADSAAWARTASG